MKAILIIGVVAVLIGSIMMILDIHRRNKPIKYYTIQVNEIKEIKE
jgi:hypothetical protein